MQRKITRQIRIGSIAIGGGAPISVQSMTNTKTQDAEATVRQIEALASAGCDIVRLAVPDKEAAANIGAIKAQVKVPLVADIHFDYRLALIAIEQGIDALRLNPGNIGGAENVRRVAEAAKARGIPIRIGVNAGSLDKRLLEKYGGVTAEALVESALEHVRLLEEQDFYDMKISLKAHDVPLTLAAYRLMSERCDYPLHLGVTEAGTVRSGIVKSAVGIGTLLAEGIGDTLRVSLTGDPVVEVRVAREILKSLGLRDYGPTLISCPTCGRGSPASRAPSTSPLWDASSTALAKRAALMSASRAARASDSSSAREKSCARSRRKILSRNCSERSTAFWQRSRGHRPEGGVFHCLHRIYTRRHCARCLPTPR